MPLDRTRDYESRYGVVVSEYSLREGAELGRYVLTHHLAVGGMADVWLARATGAVGFQKTVVIKTLRMPFVDDPGFVSMFINEAHLASTLNHPNIVHIFDLGETDQIYFIVMEYIFGQNLGEIKQKLYNQQLKMPIPILLRIAVSVCDAMEYAHGAKDENGKLAGVIHRDISPENIMVTFEGVTKVLDFGIAKATTSAKQTEVGILKGKFSYIPPEQSTVAHT